MVMGPLCLPVDEDEISPSFIEDDGRKNTVGSEGNYCRLDDPLEMVIDILFGCGAGRQYHRLEHGRPLLPPTNIPISLILFLCRSVEGSGK